MHETTPPRRPGEAVFAIFLLIVSLVLLQQAYAISGFSSLSSAGVFPMLAAATMVGAIVAALWQLRTAPVPADEATEGRLARFGREILPLTIIVFLALTVAYMLALERVGFLISSAAFLFLSIWYLYRRNPLLIAAISAGALAVIYVVFRYVFSVLLP
jgi:putative tricarboxylic transport membrane protein